MGVKIKIIRSKIERIPVEVHRPSWREFINY